MIAEIQQWQFVWPALLFASLLPLLAVWLLPPAHAHADAALRVPFDAELRALATTTTRRPRARLLWLPLLAWALLCVAAARPQLLGEVMQPPQTGRDLMLVVDLSGSMAEEDMQVGAYIVDRLTAVKAVLGDFLDRRVGDRVGLLVFGQRAYAVTPLTLDRNSVRRQLDDTVVGLAGQETAIGDAIALAVKRLTRKPDKKAANGANATPTEASSGANVGAATARAGARANSEAGPKGERQDGASQAANGDAATPQAEAEPQQQVVILLTDGVNTAGVLTPDKAAELARSANVRVHTIGFGAEERLGMWALPARSSIDEPMLRNLADTTGGRYFRARDTNELAGIYAELDRIEPAARQGEVQRPRIERYSVPLAAALVLAALAFALRQLPGVAR